MTNTRSITKGLLVTGLASLSLASPALAAKIVGDNGDNRLTGTNRHDLIVGRQGNDTLDGLRGNDRIVGGQGNDSINGRQGQDKLFGNAGNDNINGWSGNDRIRGNEGDDTLRGDVNQAGDRQSRDWIWGGPGADTIFGGDARDHLFGGADNDTINGEAGNDLMSGGAGDDVQRGNGGNDRIFANVGNDRTYGGQGNDELWAMTQKDTGADGGDYVSGEEGRDVIRTRDLEADTVNCGPGRDTAILDNLDVIEDATPGNPNGSCENVVRANPVPGEASSEDATEAPATENQQD
jgi:Ca2+-binding RTX toxin-like protein